MSAFARIVFVAAWHAAAAPIFLAASAIALGLPPSAWGRMQVIDAWSLALGYGMAAVVTAIAFLAARSVRPSLIFVLGAAAFLVAWPLGPAVLRDWSWLPSVVHDFSGPAGLDWRLSGLGVSILALLASLLNLGQSRAAGVRRPLWLLPVSLLALCALLLPGPFAKLYRGLDRPIELEVPTTRFPVRVSYFRGRLPAPEVNGGALQVVGDRLLLVTGGGRFHALKFDASGSALEVAGLPYRAPLNTAEFRDDTPALEPRHHRRFRVMDLLLISAPGAEPALFVSHHHWDRGQRCSRVRLSAFVGDPTAFMDGRADERWRTHWETTDCLPVDLGGEEFFAGHQAGGALLQDGGRRLLLALGDQGFDGLQTSRAVSRDPSSEFGKITSIDLKNGGSRIYASGLRSPGGLYRKADGRVWLLDHGPRGGDELNLLSEGADYGWPCRTLGAPYDGFGWRPPAQTDCTGPFTDPAFAWIPSIGTAALAGVRGPGFEAWWGDLLVGGLASRGLARVIWLNGRPVLSESLPLDERVRDLAEDSYGRIVLWTDSGALIMLQAGDPSTRF